MGQRFYYTIFKNNLVYGFGLLLLHLLVFLLRPFSLKAKFSFGRLVGYAWYLIDFPNRELCRRDMGVALERILPPYRRGRAQKLCMSNMIAYIFETYFSTALTREELLGLVNTPDWADKLRSTLKEGKGAIVLTGHFSNEGLLCYLVAAHGHASCIARYQRVFNDAMVSHRRKMNVDTLNEFETSYSLLLKLLEENEIILATIDRPLKRVKGVYVEFFGNRIIAPYYPIDLARISGAPVFTAFLNRNRHGYDMHFDGPTCVPADMDERESREKYTQQVFSTLEKMIKAHPHEWQWQHKRFTKKHWGVPRYESTS